MTNKEKVSAVYAKYRAMGRTRSQKEMAEEIGMNPKTFSAISLKLIFERVKGK